MENKTNVFEKTSFIIKLTIVAGFLNSYTTTIYNKTVTFHTGNLTKFGFYLGNFDFENAFQYLLIILFFISGVILSEFIKKYTSKWREISLSLCVLVTIALSFINNESIVCFSLYVYSGLYINLFKTWKYGSHTVSVATGNLKNLGGFIFNAIIKGVNDRYIALEYGLIIFSYPCGAFFGALLTNYCINKFNYGNVSLLFASFVLFLSIIQLKKTEH